MLDDVRRDVLDAWQIWQTSPRRYTTLTAELPGVVVAMEAAMEDMRPHQITGDDGAAAVSGALLLVAAIAAARRGDAWTARARLCRAAPIADKTGECNTCWTAFGPTNVAMYAESVEMESGEAVEGLRLAERVDHDRSPSIERRVAFLLDQVKGYQQRRDYAAALLLLQTAETEAPEDMRHRPAVREIVQTVAERSRGAVSRQAARLAVRIGQPA